MAIALDLAVVVITAIFAFTGAKNGLIGEVFRFAAVLGGFIVAFVYYPDLQAVMAPLSDNLRALQVTAFILIYLVVFFAVLGIGFIVRKFVKAISLGWADRTFGAILGILKAGVIAWAACLSISSFPVQDIQGGFGQSIVYKTYQATPKFMNLENMMQARDAFRRKKAEVKSTDDADTEDAEPVDTRIDI